MNGEPSIAFVGHLESAEAYRTFFSKTRGPDLGPLRVGAIEPVLRHLEPMPVCDFVLRSPTGSTAYGRYVDAFLLVDGAWHPAAAVRRVRQACAEAVHTGARLATLGGFSSIVGESARLDPVREFQIAFTTGNTLTAAAIAAQVASAARELGARPGVLTVTIVGAAGDVGSGVCRILSRQGWRLLLVGRKRAPLFALAGELAGTEVCSWEEAAPRSDLVVLVASAAHGAVALDGVPASAVVLDAGHPPNARPAESRRYARAGRVAYACVPETDLPAILDLYWPGETHACFGEGVALALEGRWESYSRGRGGITSARALEILGVAARHGIEPAPLHFDSSP